jgi:hypothetical protein
MTMSRLIAVLAALALAATGCTSKPKPAAKSPSSSPSASASASPLVTSRPQPAPVSLIVHMTKGYDGIALYTVAKNKERVLLKGTRLGEPRFVDATTISYVESTGDGATLRNSLRQMPIAGGPSKTLFSTPVSITTYAWSPGRTAVAFLGHDDRGYGFYVWNRGGKVELRRRIPSQLGRDGTDLDEQHVEWSKNGERVLVVATGAGAPGDAMYSTLFVISKGKDLIAPRVGTFGRWISADEIVYEEFAGEYQWHLVDVATGNERVLSAAPKSARPALWRDKTAMVYDRADDDLTLHLYSFTDGTDRVIATGGASPVWVATNTIAYSNVAACTNASECGPDRWRATGGVKRLVIGGATTALALTSTFAVDAF